MLLRSSCEDFQLLIKVNIQENILFVMKYIFKVTLTPDIDFLSRQIRNAGVNCTTISHL